MKNYNHSMMFEMLLATMQRNTVYQRLRFEQVQLGRVLTEKEIEKIWEDEIGEIGQFAITVEDDIAKLYGDEGVE